LQQAQWKNYHLRKKYSFFKEAKNHYYSQTCIIYLQNCFENFWVFKNDHTIIPQFNPLHTYWLCITKILERRKLKKKNESKAWCMLYKLYALLIIFFPSSSSSNFIVFWYTICTQYRKGILNNKKREYQIKNI
jgi:hypothetical protein